MCAQRRSIREIAVAIHRARAPTGVEAPGSRSFEGRAKVHTDHQIEFDCMVGVNFDL